MAPMGSLFTVLHWSVPILGVGVCGNKLLLAISQEALTFIRSRY